MTRLSALRMEQEALVNRLRDFDDAHDLDSIRARADAGSKQAAADLIFLSLTIRLPLVKAIRDWANRNGEEYATLVRGQGC